MKVTEELDLTQVAEAFGGYIVEEKKKNEKEKQTIWCKKKVARV